MQAGIHGFALGHDGRADIHVDVTFVVHVADPGLAVTTHVRAEVELPDEILEVVARHALVIDEYVFQRA